MTIILIGFEKFCPKPRVGDWAIFAEDVTRIAFAIDRERLAACLVALAEVE